MTLVFCILNFLEFKKYEKMFIDFLLFINKRCQIIIVSPDYYLIQQELQKNNLDLILCLKDEAKGLGYARNIALNACNTKNLGYMSIDSYINSYDIIDSIEKNLNYYFGVALLTRKNISLDNHNNYLDQRWVNKITIGEKKVIGSPFFYNVERLKHFGGFNVDCKYCDDTELAERLDRVALKQVYINKYCYEAESTKEEIKARFRMYGKSDAQYYNLYKNTMTTKKRIKSFFHSLITELNYKNSYKLLQIYYAIIRFISFLRSK